MTGSYSWGQPKKKKKTNKYKNKARCARRQRPSVSSARELPSLLRSVWGCHAEAGRLVPTCNHVFLRRRFHGNTAHRRRPPRSSRAVDGDSLLPSDKREDEVACPRGPKSTRGRQIGWGRTSAVAPDTGSLGQSTRWNGSSPGTPKLTFL